MKKKMLAVFATALIATGCMAATGNNSSVVYKEGQALSRAEVASGRITSIQRVKIESRDGAHQIIGGAAGGVLGGALGNEIGDGLGNRLMTGIGALAGAAAGVLAANKLSTTDGYALTIEMTRGGEMQIVQAADVDFVVGESVNVQRMGKTFRVLKANN